MDVSREIILPVDRDTAWEAVTDGSPWAGGAWNGPRAQSSAAATASPSYPLGSAWVVSAIEWEPPLERLREALELVAA